MRSTSTPSSMARLGVADDREVLEVDVRLGDELLALLPATGGSGRCLTAAARSRNRANIWSTSSVAMAATVPLPPSAEAGFSVAGGS